MLALLALVLLVAGSWLALSLADHSWATGVPGGAAVRRLNREAGRWLLDRSSPLPDCPTGDVATAAAGEPAGGGAEKAREAVEGLFRWTDEKGVAHFVDEEERVPERYRAGAKIRSLPVLTVYHGQYSRLRQGAGDVAPAEPRPSAPGAGARAVVYSAEWCGACQKTKAWLREQGVAVEERDIDKDPRALAELVAIAGKDPAIPVTVIGKKVVGGFDPAELRSAIAAHR
ncbi:MAG TPA: glutaredoxin family protein [Anaeromyxobacteraceae bacterium]